MWKGATFRVQISTLQMPKRQGGWGLIDIEAKCRALLIGLMWAQNMKKSSATATWLREWKLDGPGSNPPYIEWIPMTLEYLYRYALYMVYIAPPPPRNDEALRTFKLRVYNTLHPMATATRESKQMRIKQLHPDTQWMPVWKTYIRSGYRRKSHPCGTSWHMI